MTDTQVHATDTRDEKGFLVFTRRDHRDLHAGLALAAQEPAADGEAAA